MKKDMKEVLSRYADLVAKNQNLAWQTKKFMEAKVDKFRSASFNYQYDIARAMRNADATTRKEIANLVIATLKANRIDAGDLGSDFVCDLQAATGQIIHPTPWAHDPFGG